MVGSNDLWQISWAGLVYSFVPFCEIMQSISVPFEKPHFVILFLSKCAVQD